MKVRIFLASFSLVAKLGIATFYDELSSLEKSVVDEGLKEYSLVPVEDAKNQIVNNIYIYTAKPFSDNSRFLTILNNLHINTKDTIIRRMLFQREGEPFSEALVRDSELMLRSQKLVRSLAVIIPVRKKTTHRDEGIDLLVATKDLLSFQPRIALNGSAGVLVNLTLGLGEHNLLGLNKAIEAIYDYQQGGQIISASYFDPQVIGSKLQFFVKPSVILKNNNVFYDGYLGELRLERPLLTETDFFGYGASLAFGSKPITDFSGSTLRPLIIKTSQGIKEVERYRLKFGSGSIFTTLSFGRMYKNNLNLSYNLYIKRPSVPDRPDLTESDLEYLKNHSLPKNELESFITVGYSYFQNKFLTMYDYDNYRLQEKKRVGPTFSVSNDFASSHLLKSDHNFLRPKLAASWLMPCYRDSFIQLGLSTSTRYDGILRDNLLKLVLSLATPKVRHVGRAVLEGQLHMIADSRDHAKFTLGSDIGLRGVTSRFYTGNNLFRINFELRSIPFDIWIFHAGLVVFYDVGAAFDKWRKANATHDVGFGIRILAPQISSVLFRFDLAFPVYGIGKEHNVLVPSFGTGQAF